jgi:hypothetical protein
MRELFALRIAAVAIASLVIASSLIAAARAQTNKVGTNLDPQNFGQIEWGRYLAVAGDCASCLPRFDRQGRLKMIPIILRLRESYGHIP